METLFYVYREFNVTGVKDMLLRHNRLLVTQSLKEELKKCPHRLMHSQNVCTFATLIEN